VGARLIGGGGGLLYGVRPHTYACKIKPIVLGGSGRRPRHKWNVSGM